MHKRLLAISLLLMIAGISRTLAGETPQAPETKRVAVVFIQQVFKDYQYAKDSEAAIKAKFEQDQQKIEQEIARIQEQEKALQNNPLIRPDSAQGRKAMLDLEGARIEVRSMQEDFSNRVRKEEAAFWQNMYAAFQRACKIYAEHFGYDVIIASPDPTISEEAIKASDPMAIQQEILMRRIQFVSDRANITKPITDLMNNRYKQYQKDPQKNPL